MYELVKLTENDYYIDCPAKIGVVRTKGNGVVLIDGGNDERAAKKVLSAIEARGWGLEAIFVTHAHADHTGGNAFLQKKTGCRIYASGIEAAFVRNPLLEPAGLYGGFPFRELTDKFLLAEESDALPLSDDVLPEGMETIYLAGHTAGMVGFRTKDGTAFVADSVSSEKTLEKYGVCYLWDIGASLATLKRLKAERAERFVPSHVDVTEDIAPLADANIRAIKGVIDEIRGFCANPVSFDALLKKFFDSHSLKLNAQQFALVGSTLRSYLSYMRGQGMVDFGFDGNVMVWRAI